MGRGLITVEDEAIALHASASEHFRGASEDGVPRIMEIDTWFERIWFDLVSRNMMTPERTRPSRNLIEIRPDDGARELPTAFARRAFEDNFAEYLRKVRRINNPDRFGLYSIPDVEAGRFGFVVLKGREELVLGPQPSIQPHLLDVDVESSSRYRSLINAMTDAYRRLSTAEPSAAALADYGRLTGDRTVQAAHVDGRLFDLARWQADEETRDSPDRRPLVGASYLDRNVDVLVELLERRAFPALKGQTAREVDLAWFRPAGSAWGCSPDLPEALSNLRAAFRRGLSKDWTLRTTLVLPQSARRDHPRRFDRIFDRGLIAPTGQLSPALEVVLMRGVGALTLVRVSMGGTVEFPVGSVTTDAKALERLETHLKLGVLANGEELWSRPSPGAVENAPDAVLQI